MSSDKGTTALQFMRNITGLVPFKVFLLTFKEGVD